MPPDAPAAELPVTAPATVLFDLDNTLTDHDEAFRRWATEFSVRSGIPELELHLAERWYAGRRHAFFTSLKTSFGLDASVAALHTQYRRRSAELVPHRPRLCAAIMALAEADWRLGVVTNGDPTTQRLKLRTSRLEEYFSTVVVSGAYGLRKPDPELFRLALGDLRTQSAVVVGDDLYTDVAGGRACGLTTVWVTNGRLRQAHDPTPHQAVRTVLDAVHWLRAHDDVLATAPA
ncbi:HAD family hydrolase [Streptomyces sp. NPDC050485]|uniref:HAD family hydrolase n=1 Tax=Streptomyces sp. NPDC050485 TaxID=3365617 RepID=UPI0037AC7388